ncbi:CdaR family protein [Fusibacter ferrireducens]|uniref:YbbR domain-containing protein n=1 Tax=Fusibacter ferrireducens TaxID=2785058 RepID=A0ABR9ZVA7_9FIRM|nr:CdaR family protein [Fusibacter ferrireducens]MBF4694358.1 hypothetical protein [Fusibacter ferrireducens]
MSKKPLKSFSTSLFNGIRWIRNLPRAFFTVNLSHNTGKKLFSLLLAILFWVYVMDQVDPEISKVFENVPIQLINLQELDQNNLKIMNQHDYFVNVEVSGRRNNVINLNSSSIYLWADMRGVKKGTNTISINKTINSEAVMINTIFPSDIVLQVDQIVSLPKPVKVVLNGEYATSIYQETMHVSPDEIKVTGPENIVNTVAYLGGTINISNLTSDMTKDISLVPYNYDGEIVNGVTLDNNYSNVSLKLGKNKTVELKAIVEGEPMEGYQVVAYKTIPESVLIQGDVDKINAINVISPEKIILKGDENASYIIEKDLTLPEGIKRATDDGPIQVEIEIEALQTKEFTFAAKDLPIVNLQENFVTNLAESEQMVTVKVRGIESIIKTLSKSDIHLYLNFSNVDKPGAYKLKVIVSDQDSFNNIVVDPVYIDVDIVDQSESSSNATNGSSSNPTASGNKGTTDTN